MIIKKTNGPTNEIYQINIFDKRIENPIPSGDLASPRLSPALANFNNKVYLFGGFTGPTIHVDFYEIDLITFVFTKKTVDLAFPPRSGFSTVQLSDKLLLVEGCNIAFNTCYAELITIDLNKLSFSLDKITDSAPREDFPSIFYNEHFISFSGCFMNNSCYDQVRSLKVPFKCPGDCSGNGKCASTGCVCRAGNFGYDCSLSIKCKDDCYTNGTCQQDGSCSCFPAYKGNICNAIIETCSKNCTNVEQGECDNKTEKCVCHKGFTGVDCSLMLSENDKGEVIIVCKDNCNNNGVCDVGKCICSPGFSGETCNIDEAAEKRKKEELEKKKNSAVVEEKKEEKKEEKVTFMMEGEQYELTIGKCGNCNGRGICFNEKCFCNNGFTGEDCEMTYKEYESKGYPISEYYLYLGVTGAAPFAVLLLFVLIS